ncbi:MAG: hypothetical protein J5803_05755 [Desulfovibrio sp.]|nr:hypothetical protein [Desulfovibrio sp.]
MEKKDKKNGKNVLTSMQGVTGLAIGLEAVKSLISPLQFLRRNQDLLRMNKKHLAQYAALDFNDVLLAWGIRTDEEKRLVCTSKKREIVLGIALSLFGLFSFCLAFLEHGTLFFVSLFASLSVIQLGLVLALTSYWRLLCLERKRFYPFFPWLKKTFVRLFSF